MWESNPPMRLPTPNTGFEDQRAHQHPSTPIISILLAVLSGFICPTHLKMIT